MCIAAMNYLDKETKAAGAQGAAIVKQKVVNLALQGGGTHGAFTWGALDRLLEDERLSFDGITASSAGAVNATLLTDGWAAGGREGAKNALRRFWRRLSEQASRSVFRPSLIDQVNPRRGLEHSPGFLVWESLTFFASPYQLNPFNYNPLKHLIDDSVDFARVRRQNDIKLFVCATDIRTAKIKVFNGAELRCEHVLASTCLPMLMQAVEIDGEFYWDGGYAGNPAIFPLVYQCQARDIVTVHVTPADRKDIPRTSIDIMNRMQEISFNTALIREMRAVAFINRRIEEGKMAEGKRMLVHVIEGEDLFQDLSASSRLNGDWGFLTWLYNKGRERAEEWLKINFDRVGLEPTIDLEERYF
jgi:NTE family protein